MPIHSESQISPYTPRQLFDLVADIERYPEFLPWCRAARILERREGELVAELVICFKHLTERYTSRVTLTPPVEGNGAIDVVMTKGPFDHLVNQWKFVPTDGGGTNIEFFLDFKFKSRLMEMMIGSVFAKATEKMVQAFKQRADAMYGNKSS